MLSPASGNCVAVGEIKNVVLVFLTPSISSFVLTFAATIEYSVSVKDGSLEVPTFTDLIRVIAAPNFKRDLFAPAAELE